MARRGPFRSLIYSVLRPVYYPARHYYHLLRVQTAGLNVSSARSISMDCSHEELARRIKTAVSPCVRWRQVDLHSGQIRDNSDLYFERHREFYDIDKGRAKALDHALWLELLDFSRAGRYCDVASCASPIQITFPALYPKVEFWMQDLTYQDDLPQMGIHLTQVTTISSVATHGRGGGGLSPDSCGARIPV